MAITLIGHPDYGGDCGYPSTNNGFVANGGGSSQPGDLVVVGEAWVLHPGDTPLAVAPPAGWTLLATAMGQECGALLAWRILDGTEPLTAHFGYTPSQPESLFGSACYRGDTGLHVVATATHQGVDQNSLTGALAGPPGAQLVLASCGDGGLFNGGSYDPKFRRYEGAFTAIPDGFGGWLQQQTGSAPITLGSCLYSAASAGGSTAFTATPDSYGGPVTADRPWGVAMIAVQEAGNPLPPGTECWAPLTARLKDRLAAPFSVRIGGLLDRALSAIARELSGCTERVTLLATPDARGAGQWTFPVRFEPIIDVAGVQRLAADGSILETYTVAGWAGRLITVTGTQAPASGDTLSVSYTYEHQGLEKRVAEALAELNVLTAEGDYLDGWGAWFAAPRLDGEQDGAYSRRIIDRATLPRNTIPGILAAVRTLTGGSPYIVEWTAPGFGWVYRPTGAPAWLGGSDVKNHLIWSVTSRFTSLAEGGGRGVFEVWVPSGSGYTTEQILAIVKQYQSAGTKAFVRYYS